MTTIIERPSGGSSGALIGVIIGVVAAVVIGMIAFGGAFDRTPADTNFTVETPAPPAMPPDTQPTEAQPAPQRLPTPDPSPTHSATYSPTPVGRFIYSTLCEGFGWRRAQRQGMASLQPFWHEFA